MHFKALQGDFKGKCWFKGTSLDDIGKPSLRCVFSRKTCHPVAIRRQKIKSHPFLNTPNFPYISIDVILGIKSSALNTALIA